MSRHDDGVRARRRRGPRRGRGRACCGRCSSATSRPDLVLGTSVGALNGAMVARDPTLGVDRAADRAVAGRRRAAARCTATGRCAPSAGRCRPAPTSTPRKPLQASGSSDEFGDLTFEELPVRFQVCAASIERAAEHWFDSGPVVDAVVASAAVPGLLPPAKVGDEHYLDGGIVNSIPVGRAVQLGADADLRAPGRPDRPAAQAAATAVGGGAGVVRDRPPAPVRPRDGRAARRRRGARAARRGGTSAKDDSLLGPPRLLRRCSDRIDATYEATRRRTSTSTCEPTTVIWAAAAAGGRARRDRAGRRWSGSRCRCG